MSTRRALLVVGGIAVFVILLLVFAIGAVVFAVTKTVDATATHRCALAYVQRSPAAAAVLGSPITQRGITGGSTNWNDGRTTDDLTFKVAGPLGEASVEAKGLRSDFQSHLSVVLGRNGESTTIYDGARDCPEIHEK